MNSRLFTGLSILIILITACAPATQSPTPPPIVTEEPIIIPVTGMAVVQSVEVKITENSPLQVNVIARGQLPDSGCTTITSVDQAREGNVFKVTVKMSVNPAATCLATLTPFEQVIALDTANLPPASYIVDVNGVQMGFELLTRDMEKFKQILVEALNTRNYELLKLMLNQPLVIALYRSQGTAYDVEPAIEQLKLNHIGTTTPIIADLNKDINLFSVDPLSVFGLDVGPNHALFVSGWGLDGKDEAILYMNYLLDGSLYWHGVLVAKGGFAQSNGGSISPVDTTAYATSVPYVMAQKDVTIHKGPGTNYGMVGQIFSGQTAQVTGVNSNGSWWRVICPDTSVGSCWVSADPNLTQPTTAPHYDQPLPSTDPQPTSVTYVMAQQDIKIFDGPSHQYNVIGFIASGQTAKVTGISADGSWWRVVCPNDTVGSCWVLSDPAYTKPSDGLGNNPPPDNSVQPTSVQYVMAQQDINMRSGPGTQYSVIGSVANGQIAKVTGISADGNWWRVMCPDDTVGSCWVSANPGYTQPTQQP